MLGVTLSVLLIKEKGTCDPFLAEVKHQYNEQKKTFKSSQNETENLNRQGNSDAEKNTNLLTYKRSFVLYIKYMSVLLYSCTINKAEKCHEFLQICKKKLC